MVDLKKKNCVINWHACVCMRERMCVNFCVVTFLYACMYVHKANNREHCIMQEQDKLFITKIIIIISNKNLKKRERKRSSTV